MFTERKRIIGRNFAMFVVGSSLAYSTPSSADEMTFKKIPMNQTTTIYAEGEITDRTPQVLAEFLKAEDPEGILILEFNSKGGNFLASLKLGRMIRDQSIGTSIGEWEFVDKGDYIDKNELKGGECLSACAMAFMGGFSRDVGEGKVLGFNQFDVESGTTRYDVVSATQIISAATSEYLREMGADPTLFVAMSSTPPKEMFIPSSSQLVEMGIKTPESFSGFKLKAVGDRIVASSIFPQNAIYAEKVVEVEASCRQGIPQISFYGAEEDGLSPKFANAQTTRVDGFDIRQNWGVGVHKSYGKSHIKLFSRQRLLATISIDYQDALELARGGYYIRVNSTAAQSGVTMSAGIGKKDTPEPALRAIFANCRSIKK